MSHNNNDYYVPALHEFVPGFTYEVFELVEEVNPQELLPNPLDPEVVEIWIEYKLTEFNMNPYKNYEQGGRTFRKKKQRFIDPLIEIAELLSQGKIRACRITNQHING
jgi:hypothetical protein